MKTIVYTLILFISVAYTNAATAQCDTIVSLCEKHITDNYLSDSQTYRALLNGDDVAEFSITLYAGNTYRMAACSGIQDGTLLFKLVDAEKNVLFSNSYYGNAPYWDFFVENTMQVTLEATLDKSKVDSGCAVILIGFKK
jgi:hypothetical protein